MNQRADIDSASDWDHGRAWLPDGSQQRESAIRDAIASLTGDDARFDVNHAGESSPWLSNTRNEASTDRISKTDKHDWSRAAFLLQSSRHRYRVREDYIRLRSYKLPRQSLCTGASRGVAIVDVNVAALYPSAFGQTLTQRG
jgi:hypothetical protein